MVGGSAGAIHGNEKSKARARSASRSQSVASTNPAVSSTLVLETQKALVTHGFDPGKIDGIFGANTRSAIEAYQRQNGLLVTGQASDALLKHMLENKG